MPILTFPRVRQSESFSCGASALQGVLAYYGIDKREGELIEALGVSEEDGVVVAPLINYLRAQGLKVTAKTMTTQEVRGWLDRGVPVILMLQAWSDTNGCDYSRVLDEGHYAIAIGYDKTRLIFEDPSVVERAYLSFEELEDRWHEVDEGERVLTHFGVAVWGVKPAYDPAKLVHIATDRLVTRWIRSRTTPGRPRTAT